MRIVIETDDPVRVGTDAGAATRSLAADQAGEALSGGAAPADLSAQTLAPGQADGGGAEVAATGGVAMALDASDGGPAPADG
jgi:hypothetical protein